mmetsp:Transcript_97362/g.145927  ORF Transcript_97362/g.145927 Transcript_97362/m.145927 type:complete len:89 (+) Transcript_97362:67-333(+)
MSAITKLFNPSFYTQSWGSLTKAAHAYYHPLVKNNSSVPLWHSMLAVSAIMYTGTYVARVYPEIQEKRAVKRAALAEYYEKHGGGDHH